MIFIGNNQRLQHWTHSPLKTCFNSYYTYFEDIWRTAHRVFGIEKYHASAEGRLKMQAKITRAMVQNLTTAEERLKVYDTLLKGLVLFVRPTGKKSWFVDYKKPDGKRTNHLIGSAQLFTVTQAREMAREFLTAVARGENPAEPEKEPENKIKLGDFMKGKYERWVLDHRRSGNLTIGMIKTNFGFLYDTPIENITVAVIEEWRANRKKETE
jgi:hypothetical protein